MRLLVIIHVNPRRLCNERKSWGWKYLCNSKLVSVRLLSDSGLYFLVRLCAYINNQTTKDKFKSLSALDWRTL